MISGVTRHMLPHLSGVPHLHVNRPLICLPFFPLNLPADLLLVESFVCLCDYLNVIKPLFLMWHKVFILVTL